MSLPADLRPALTHEPTRVALTAHAKRASVYAVAGVLGLMIVMSLVIRDADRYHELVRDGIHTTDEVVLTAEHGRKLAEFFNHVDVAFVTPTGLSRARVTFNTEDETYELGQRVEVVYPPDDQQGATIVGERDVNGWRSMLEWFLGFAGIAFFWTAVVMARDVSRWRRALSERPWTTCGWQRTGQGKAARLVLIDDAGAADVRTVYALRRTPLTGAPDRLWVICDDHGVPRAVALPGPLRLLKLGRPHRGKRRWFRRSSWT